MKAVISSIGTGKIRCNSVAFVEVMYEKNCPFDGVVSFRDGMWCYRKAWLLLTAALIK